MQYKNKKSSVAPRTLLKNGQITAKNGVRKIRHASAAFSITAISFAKLFT